MCFDTASNSTFNPRWTDLVSAKTSKSTLVVLLIHDPAAASESRQHLFQPKTGRDLGVLRSGTSRRGGDAHPDQKSGGTADFGLETLAVRRFPAASTIICQRNTDTAIMRQ